MPKRLVVCCDGTWNTADQETDSHPCPTNVTKVALSVAPEDSAGNQQRVYYHRGVGTSRWDRITGGAFGSGLAANVFDAYRFLVDTYEPGDVLYFFGFSRGAFTARSTTGMVRNCGILRRENADRIGEAWSLYRASAERPSGVASTLFRRAYSHEPRIRFIGVWDTVGALGLPVLGPKWLRPVIRRVNRRWEFHDTRLSSRVDGAFHALAIDERREAFEPTLWHRQPHADGQELKQVWFSGAHSDVGGGYSGTGLSDIALLWMAERAREYGLEFRPDAFRSDAPAPTCPGDQAEFTVVPDALAPAHDSRTAFYRLTRPVDRPIGRAAHGSEYLATSANDRYAKDPEYRPRALAEYLAGPRSARLEPVECDSGVPPLPPLPTA